MKTMYKNIIRETYLSKIRPYYDTDYIKAITGLRRSGKSIILQQIKDELLAKGVEPSHILFYDLEGESGEGITTRKKLEGKLHKDIKDNDLYYIFIDEVQHIIKFEIAIASVRVTYHCSLFITGSNSKLLRGKLKSRLTGRAKEFVVYPFSYKEAYDFKKLNNINIGERDFNEYLKWGGMPQRYLEPDEQAIHSYHSDIVNSIIEKDIFGTHKKIARESFNKVSQYIISSSGREFSASSIANYMYGSMKKEEKETLCRTILNYAKYLSESFITVPCSSYSLTGKKALKSVDKYYCPSPGIKTAFTNTIDTDPSFALESIVFLELLSRGYDVYRGTMRNGEIDFVAIKGSSKCLIQVAYLMVDPATREREFGAFKKIKEHSPAYVLSLDPISQSTDGIANINIIDWLLGRVDLQLG